MAILVYSGFELLDATGPASVFAGANHALAQRGQPPFYEIAMLSAAGGPVASSAGVAVETKAIGEPPPALDTFLVAGAERECLLAAIADSALRQWTPRWAEAAARFGSICAGTFILAALGLIEGRRVASHWSACAQLAALYPGLTVDENSIYVEDGRVWTSAGVTAGIDMALAMVARDIDTAVANDVARKLVLYARRPGYQSQFSPLLRAQTEAGNPFGELLQWIHGHLDQPLEVPVLAARAGLSERTFFRKFTTIMSETPARMIEAIRLDAARDLLLQGQSVKLVARRVGLSSPARLARAFERRFGVTPGLYRRLHAGTPA